MRYFESWFSTVSREVARALEDGCLTDSTDQPALQKKLYERVHLHGLGDLAPILELPHSLLRGISPVPATFVESGWIVLEVLEEDLLLERGDVVIKSPREHHALIYDQNSKSVSIRRQRYTPAIMPDWDRIISAYGWPSLSDARIYLPTVKEAKTVAKVVEQLDSTKLRWHMKTSRWEKIARPDSVVLYVDSPDVTHAVDQLQKAVPTAPTKIPGFSLPLNEVWTIGLGTVRPNAREASYGWSFAAEIANNLIELANHSSNTEEKANLALANLIDSSRRGQVDVKLPW